MNEQDHSQDHKVIRIGDTDIDLVARRRNELVMGKYRLSKQAQRLFLYILSQVRDDHDERTEYSFSISRLAQAIDIDRSQLYKDMVAVLDELERSKVMLEVVGPDGKTVANSFDRVGFIVNKQRVRLSTTGGARIDGEITVSLHKELLPYVLKMKERYTTVELKYVFRLSSGYAMRLYDLLKAREFMHQAWRVSRDELRNLLGVAADEYALFGDFRRFVLERAQDDIATHTDLAFDIDYVRTGQTVTDLVFRLRRGEGDDVDVLPGSDKHKVFKLLLDLGLKAKEAEGVLQSWWHEDRDSLVWHAQEAKRLKAVGKLKNPVGWFLAGLKADYRPTRSLFADMRQKAERVRQDGAGETRDIRPTRQETGAKSLGELLQSLNANSPETLRVLAAKVKRGDAGAAENRPTP